MKKSMFVLIFVLLFISSLYVMFNIYTNSSYGRQTERIMKSVNVDDKQITELKNILVTSNYLRDGYYNSNSVDNETKIKQIILSLSKDDYREIDVKPTKVMCVVKAKLWFSSSTTCKIKVISKETIRKYNLKLFNSDEDIEIEEFTIKGLLCKYSDGYYCQINSYSDSWHDYSLISKAFKDEDTMYLYEYYLRVDDSKEDQCIKYYGKDYCSDKTKELPVIKDTIIKNNGVYYKHTFRLNDNKEYYLAISEVVY